MYVAVLISILELRTGPFLISLERRVHDEPWTIIRSQTTGEGSDLLNRRQSDSFRGRHSYSCHAKPLLVYLVRAESFAIFKRFCYVLQYWLLFGQNEVIPRLCMLLQAKTEPQSKRNVHAGNPVNKSECSSASKSFSRLSSCP